MKTMSILVFAAVMAYSEATLADSTVDAAQLGRMQGILNVCAKVNPRDASKYLLQIKAVIGDASKQAVDHAAKTDEYQQAYQAVTEELKNMAPEEMVQACNRYLSTTN